MIQGNDDNLPFGININDKDKSSTRIIFAHTNGLNAGTDAHSLYEIVISSQIYNASVLLLAETNTHWKNKRAYDNLRKTIVQYWKGISIITSETNLSWYSIYKPAGTAIIAKNKVRSRKLKSGEDSHGLGRWYCLTLQRRESRMVRLIPVYKACNGPIDPNKKMTALTQQLIILNSKYKTIESIPSLNVTHLITFTNDLVRQKHEIILESDANKQFVSSRGYDARLCSKCKLLDPIDQHNGITNEPNIFIRGSQRIDYMFYSKTTSSIIIACGIPSFG